MDIVKQIPAVYLGKKLNGTDVTVTEAGLIAAAKEFGDQAVVRLFSNGEIATDNKGRTVLDALKEGGSKK